LIEGGITFSVFSLDDIPDFIVSGNGIEGICTIDGGYLSFAIECIVIVGGGIG
jgi:hypothetical protein